MYEKTLDFYQIYFKETQLEHLYDFAKPYFNATITPYFENSLIASIVPNSKADLISVSSWKLRYKRNSMPSVKVLKENNTLELTKERIITYDFDVAILTPRGFGHKTIFMSKNWHGKAWTDSFPVLSSFLSKELRLEVPSELRYAIYENHFIAKRQIYRDYVASCLIPTIQFMEKEANVFINHSGYRKHKERVGDFESIAEYERATGLKDWPISAFLLERLFSIWINSKSVNVINL